MFYSRITESQDSIFSLGNLIQQAVACTIKQNCVLVFRGTILCFYLWPLPFVLLLDISEQNLALSLHPPFRFLYTLVRFPLNRLFPGIMNCLSFLSLSLQEKYFTPFIICDPSLDSYWYVLVSPALASPALESQIHC